MILVNGKIQGNTLNKNDNLKFQLIILSHVLEHNHDPIKLIKDAIKYADQDAIILIEVPDQRYVFFKGLLGGKFGMDYHVFSRRSLTRLLKKCKVNIVKTAYDLNSSYRGRDPGDYYCYWAYKPSREGKQK